jgi:hypothetical protein
MAVDRIWRGHCQVPAATGVALFGKVAGMYEEGYLGRQNQIARPTREKEEFYLHARTSYPSGARCG